MKNRIQVILVILVLAAIVIGLSAHAQRTAPARPSWEYRDAANLQLAQLNEWGAEGWELVNVTAYGSQLYFVFKRPK